MSDPPGVALDRLRAYLDTHRPGMLRGELTVRLIPGGRSNLTYLLSDGAQDWVLRRPPLGHVLATAHDMGREHRILSALADSPVPVPRPLLYCPETDVLGAPFYVMRRVRGEVYASAAQAYAALGDAGAARLARDLVGVLARLHALDPAEYGLADFGRPAGFLDRQLTRWRGQLDASRSREVPGIDELARRLAVRVPKTQRHSIVHGDYRLDNVMAGPDGRIAGVLDWEMATLGDPLTDVGLLRVYWDGEVTAGLLGHGAAPSDFPAAGAAVRWYAADAGLDLTPLPWYVGFGYFKLAVILEGIHYRYTLGKTVGPGFDTIGDAVAPLVSGGLTALDGW